MNSVQLNSNGSDEDIDDDFDTEYLDDPRVKKQQGKKLKKMRKVSEKR